MILQPLCPLQVLAVCKSADLLLMVLDAMQPSAVISRPPFLPALGSLLGIAVCKSANLLLLMTFEMKQLSTGLSILPFPHRCRSLPCARALTCC